MKTSRPFIGPSYDSVKL